MTQHLYFSSFKLEKNVKTGEWQLGEVSTNEGTFVVGEEANAKIKQEYIDKFVAYVRSEITPEILTFLQEEVVEEEVVEEEVAEEKKEVASKEKESEQHD